MPLAGGRIDPLVPEIWAAESVNILTENMVMANLVHRDFEPEIARYGQVVHTRRPGEFTGRRKRGNQAVTVQDIAATDIPVTLDQWVHVSFFLRDGEESLSFVNLAEYYLEPALTASARTLDQTLAAQAAQFLNNSVGGLGGITADNAKDRLIDTRRVMDANKAHDTGRRLILAPNSEAEMLKTDLFISAERVGDGGRALREASLGRKFGFDTFKSLNIPSRSGGNTATAAAVVGAVAAGGDEIVSDGEVVYGQYFTAVGDMSPLRAGVVTPGTAAWTIETTRPTIGAIANDAVLVPYATGTVVGAFTAGTVTPIRVTGTGVPTIGSLVAFNDTVGGVIREQEYIIIAVDLVSAGVWDITLDRPIATALANSDVVNYGPNGDMNFAFHRDALTLVNRPLAAPMSGLARSAVVNFEGMSIRVVITYDGTNQGHLVTVDSLFGVAVLNRNLGAVLLG